MVMEGSSLTLQTIHNRKSSDLSYRVPSLISGHPNALVNLAILSIYLFNNF